MFKAIVVVAGVATSMFFSYCIYYDKQRRLDPEYRRKVAERRRRERQDQSRSPIPNMSVEKYFVQEIKLGEALISKGDIESGVDHLANGIMICGQPTRLLQVLQNTMPTHIFKMIVIKMNEMVNRSAMEDSTTDASGNGKNILETSSDNSARLTDLY